MAEVSPSADPPVPPLRTAAEILPRVYDELRKLAAASLAQDQPAHSLQPTALVHEAYLRLVSAGNGPVWNDTAHFFGSAAVAMRRVMVEHARRRRALRNGGGMNCVPLPADLAVERREDELLIVDEFLEALAEYDGPTAQLSSLHIFCGFSLKDAAESLGISERTACRKWAFARSWFSLRMVDSPEKSL